MALRCEFKNDDGYWCIIGNQEIPSEVSEETFQGAHEGNRTNDDVRKLWFQLSKVEMVPNGISEVFKNVMHLRITNCNLREISKENLRQFPNLELLGLSNNQLEYLSGDLFEFNKKLEGINLRDNKIKLIGPELLDGLPNLIWIDLQNNQNINIRYVKNDTSISLNNLKEEIKSKCQPPEMLLKLIKKLQTPIVSRRQQDLDKFLTLDGFKDFTIKVSSKDFKVHKMIFMARSQTFADFIKNNPDAHEWVLTDIPVEVFESILDFVYTDEPPKNLSNAREIFAAAGKLKIKSLMEILAETLMNEMEEEENLYFLFENFNLGAKFDSQKLKVKAFSKIEKQFPGGRLKNDLLDDPEKMEKLIEAKKFQDEMIKVKVMEDVGSSAK